MADYDTLASNLEDDAENGGRVIRYRIGNREVQREGSVADTDGIARAEGLAARRAAGGLFRLAKHKNPRT